MSVHLSRLSRFRIPIRTTGCHFSTTVPRPISLQIEKNDPEALADIVPEYPYGPARWYKQSNKGLYGGTRILFGNNVGPKFGVKTRRTFKPNIMNKRLWSHALGRFVQVRVQMRVLRTIDKVGGLDSYLLGEKEARIKELGMSGWWLRWAIMQTPVIQKQLARQREELGSSAMRLEGDGEADANVEAETNANVEAEVDANVEAEAAAPAKAAVEGEHALQEMYEKPDDEGDKSVAADETILEEELGPDVDAMPVGMDDAFQVEHTPELPRLKFRVGPRQHLVLTAGGWRRTRPTTEWKAKKTEKRIKEQCRRIVRAEMAERINRLEEGLKSNGVASTVAKFEQKGLRLTEQEVEQTAEKVAVRNRKMTRLRNVVEKGRKRPLTARESKRKLKLTAQIAEMAEDGRIALGLEIAQLSQNQRSVLIKRSEKMARRAVSREIGKKINAMYEAAMTEKTARQEERKMGLVGQKDQEMVAVSNGAI